MRMIAAASSPLHVILLLGPPLQLTDMFNYLGYARLGGLHGLNPYTHVIGQEMHDPVFHFATWHNLHSPYGQLFTALSYPLAFLPLPVAYWIVKVATVLPSLRSSRCVCRCARRLGRDPRYARRCSSRSTRSTSSTRWAASTTTSSCWCRRSARSRCSWRAATAGRRRADARGGGQVHRGAAAAVPAAAARPSRRRLRVARRRVLAAIPLLAMSLALFGFSLPNLSDQSTLLTPFSFPNLFGLLHRRRRRHAGVLRLADVALVVAVVLLRAPARGLAHRAGWATVALIASLAWVMPWYVIWLLPLAALGPACGCAAPRSR